MDENRERLIIENLEYQKETGKLFWKKTRGDGYKGSEAGYLRTDGYIVICIAKTLVRAHRVAWFLHYGKWPENEIDHIDGNPANNKIENLRDVLHRANLTNMKLHREGRLVGTIFNKKSIKNPWGARIKINGRRVYLGHFPTEQEAHQAYIKAYQEVNKGQQT